MNNILEHLELDKQNMIGAIDAQPAQLKLAYSDEMQADITLEDAGGIQNCVLVGMGGSALGANIVKNWLFTDMRVPFEVVRGSVLPHYVGPSTLVIVSSYSGNTVETLAAYSAAQRAQCRIIVLCGGGKLQSSAQADSINTLLLPKVRQPRLAVFASIRALAAVFQDLGWVGERDLREELLDCANFLDIVKSSINLDTSNNNTAMELANNLYQKVVLVYASPLLASAAYKWKISINENAKQRAYYNVYTELNHNEYSAVSPSVEMVVVQLASSLDSSDIGARIALTSEHLKQQKIPVHAPENLGKNHIQSLLYSVLLGDYVSYYLALLNSVDPTPITAQEQLKSSLSHQE